MREVVRQDVSLPRVYATYRIPAFGTDDYYTALVTSYILAYGKAALLYRTLVREQLTAGKSDELAALDELDEGFDVLHAEVDLAFKWAGFSLLAELLWRRAIDDDAIATPVVAVSKRCPTSGVSIWNVVELAT